MVPPSKGGGSRDASPAEIALLKAKGGKGKGKKGDTLKGGTKSKDDSQGDITEKGGGKKGKTKGTSEGGKKGKGCGKKPAPVETAEPVRPEESHRDIAQKGDGKKGKKGKKGKTKGKGEGDGKTNGDADRTEKGCDQETAPVETGKGSPASGIGVKGNVDESGKGGGKKGKTKKGDGKTGDRKAEKGSKKGKAKTVGKGGGDIADETTKSVSRESLEAPKRPRSDAEVWLFQIPSVHPFHLNLL